MQHVAEFKADPSNWDTFGLQNLEWSGEYLRNSLSAELMSKVLREVPMNASGPSFLLQL